MMQPTCPFCGGELKPDQAQPGSLPGTVLCPSCGQQVDRPSTTAPAPPAAPPATDAPALSPPPPAEPPPPPTTEPPAPASEPAASAAPTPAPPPRALEMPAWEGEGGFFARILRTCGQVLFSPARFFAASFRPGYAWALSYGLILGTFGTAMQALWSRFVASQHLVSSHAIWGLILAPLGVLVSIFLLTWILHFFLFVVGGAKKGVQATFRVMAYTEATSLFLLVPGIGMAVSFVWWLVAATAGLAAVHGIGRGRAFFAIVLPLVIILALVAGITALVVTMGLWAEFKGFTRAWPRI
ncbi:MAG: YIP1 family protein [Thermodesulfobacteriota bacterium]